MSIFRSWKSLASSLILLVLSGAPLWTPTPAPAATRVTIAVTETIASVNPYADSVLLMYNIWCQTYGCMTRYVPETQSYTSEFFESWKVEDPNTWVFTMKPGLKRHNGEPVVAE